MTYGPAQSKITWYRSPIDRAVLAELNQRSDLFGFLQSLGHLGLLALTGAAAWFSLQAGLWWGLLIALFLHGTFYAFLLNGFHELCHRTVFRTKFLNEFFLRVFSFLGWYNHVYFWASHQEHHKYTLHQPDDLEVVLPVDFTRKAFYQIALINPTGLFQRIKGVVRLSLGRLEGEEGDWEYILFPPDATEKRRRLFNWARVLLVGHLLLTVVSLTLHFTVAPGPLAAAGPGHARSVLRRLAAFPLQQHAARRPDRPHSRFSPLHPHLQSKPVRAVPLLAHELPHRASHVCRRALLQTGQAA